LFFRIRVRRHQKVLETERILVDDSYRKYMGEKKHDPEQVGSCSPGREGQPDDEMCFVMANYFRNYRRRRESAIYRINICQPPV
jgi:hypothetical protein